VFGGDILKKIIMILFLSAAFITVFSDWNVPKYINYVNDYINVLSDKQEKDLNTLISSVEKQTGSEIAVVTINTSDDITPKEMATEILNTWGVGKKDKDNGLVILLALSSDNISGKNRIEIEVGYGLEGVLPDGLIGRIIDDNMYDNLKAKNYYDAFYSGIEAMTKYISGEFKASDYEENSFNVSSDFFWIIMVGIFIIFSFFASFLSIPKCRSCGKRMKLLNTNIIERATYTSSGRGIKHYRCPRCGNTFEKAYIISKISRGSGSSGRSGGSFKGFGGGSSGGGGAGRSF